MIAILKLLHLKKFLPLDRPVTRNLKRGGTDVRNPDIGNEGARCRREFFAPEIIKKLSKLTTKNQKQIFNLSHEFIKIDFLPDLHYFFFLKCY